MLSLNSIIEYHQTSFEIFLSLRPHLEQFKTLIEEVFMINGDGDLERKDVRVDRGRV